MPGTHEGVTERGGRETAGVREGGDEGRNREERENINIKRECAEARVGENSIRRESDTEDCCS